jgi:hypothetical protein
MEEKQNEEASQHVHTPLLEQVCLLLLRLHENFGPRFLGLSTQTRSATLQGAPDRFIPRMGLHPLSPFF